jgi:hypothetical protein
MRRPRPAAAPPALASRPSPSKVSPKLVKSFTKFGQNLRPSWSNKVAKLVKSFAQVGFKKWSTLVARFCFIDVFATFFKRDALDAVSKVSKVAQKVVQSCFKSAPKLFQKCPKGVPKVSQSCFKSAPKLVIGFALPVAV